jgi:signal transduction histidine kinase
MTEIKGKEARVFSALLEQANRVIDFDRFCVALYDRRTASIVFPLIAEDRDGKFRAIETKDLSHGFRPDCFFPDLAFSESTLILIGEHMQQWLEERSLLYSVDDEVACLINEWQQVAISDESDETSTSSCPEIDLSGSSLPKSLLAVPLVARGRVMAVVWVERARAFKEDEQRILKAMANRTAGTLASLRSLERLRVINQVGQELASRAKLGVNEILNLIHDQASRLMDTRNMYVALYDEKNNRLTFPLAYYRGERERNWPERKVDPEQGLTDHVILDEEPLCPTDVDAWFRTNDIEPAVLPVPKSWAGVPMMREGRALGVIALQNDDVANLYGHDDIDVLQSMADQAAVAIDLAQLYEEYQNLAGQLRSQNEQLKKAQSKIAEAEAILTRTAIATDFVHRINNQVGTIPIWLEQIREILEDQGVVSPQIHRSLENIYNAIDDLLRAAEQLKKDSQREYIDIGEMLRALISQIRIQTPSSIQVEMQRDDGLFPVYVVVSELTHAFWNVIENGIDAMPEGGRMTVAIRRLERDGQFWVEVEIMDEGKGIKEQDQDKVFLPFEGDKPGHMGYGLWRAKNVIERLGGTISYTSEIGEGTSFVIHLPLEQAMEDQDEPV